MKKGLTVFVCVTILVLMVLFVQSHVVAMRNAEKILADVAQTRGYNSKAQCEAALQKNPNDIQALRGMIWVYQQEHDREKAWLWMQRDLKVEPRNPHTQLMHALMLDEYYKRTDEALTILDRLSQLNNTDVASSASHFADKIRQRRGNKAK